MSFNRLAQCAVCLKTCTCLLRISSVGRPFYGACPTCHEAEYPEDDDRGVLLKIYEALLEKLAPKESHRMVVPDGREPR